VREDDRERIGPLPALVDEAELRPVDIGGVVGEPVRLRFAGPPVVGVQPVVGELLHIAQVRAFDFVGKADVGKPIPEVVQDWLGSIDAKRMHRHISHHAGAAVDKEIILSSSGLRCRYEEPGRRAAILRANG